ncbi:MAG TPA: hypothetical protein VGM14_27400, partial [Streptosporangiaceae bacterium]
MSETPPESADQDQPEDGYGSQAGPSSWPDRPEYGQSTTPRYGPQSSQPGAVVQPPGGMPSGGMPPAAERVGRNEPTRMMQRDALGQPPFGRD